MRGIPKKPVYQLQGETIVRVWQSAYEASKSGYNASSIRDVCIGRRQSDKGYKWKYVNDDDKYWEIPQYTIKCTYSNGATRLFDNKKEASKVLHLTRKTVYNIVSNITKQKSQFTLQYGTDC